jgi:Dolichyl-phosphate-mannose-protein mannosyltransferase
VTTTLEDTPRSLASWRLAASRRLTAALEAAAVIASPGVLYAVLRLRGMSPPGLPDPAMHTTFVVDPHDIFLRYEALFTPSSRLREAARVGFLVPARAAYLLFGAVPGFFVFRYVLALIAIVPVYLLLKRVYCRWAGFVGIAVVMSSPVVITAWGTDYPDAAAVSYLTGALAALALSWESGRWRAGWVVGSGALLTLAVWSHGVSVPMVGVLVVVYLGVRLRRERAHLVRDVALLVGSAVVVSGLLAICSKLLLGQLNFITPTVRSARSLSQASAVRANHSASWRWAPNDAYLLVPPAIALSYVIVMIRRRSRNIGTTQLFVGLTGVLQLVTFAYLQFLGSFQALEMHYFSSVLWSSVNLMLAMTVVELTRTLMSPGVAAGSDRVAPQPAAAESGWFARWVGGAAPALLVLAVALIYEAAYRAGRLVPAMTWATGGLVLGAVVVVGAIVGRLAIEMTKPAADRRAPTKVAPWPVVSAGAVVVIVGAALILTVAPRTPHGPLANTVYDPPPSYAQALGGNDTAFVSEYRVIAELPGFVGHPSHRGEVMLTWEPSSQFGDLLGPMGMYHNAFTWVSQTFPVLNRIGVREIQSTRAAQVLLMSLTGSGFAHAVRSLAPFDPVVARRTVLHHGSYHLHVWLVNLRRRLRAPPARRRARPLQRRHRATPRQGVRSSPARRRGE